MNPTHARELLERAAASVTPTETDPAARLLGLGRRSLRRRRRAWGGAASLAVAVAVATVVTLPLPTAAPDRSQVAGAPGTTVSWGGLSVTVPKGWRTRTVASFDPCTAEPRTVHLAAGWGFERPKPDPAGSRLLRCSSAGQAWMAVVEEGVGQQVSPDRVEVSGERLLQVGQPDQHRIPSLWAYRAFDRGEIRATTAFLSGDGKGREQLLRGITWPAGPPAPPNGGLQLPGRIEEAVTDAPPSNAMVAATDARTLTRIRTALAELRDPVPAGQECTLQKPGSVGILLGSTIVVLGDATCPQAISTGGGRVRAPAGLGKELLDLIVASDRAATDRATGD